MASSLQGRSFFRLCASHGLGTLADCSLGDVGSNDLVKPRLSRELSCNMAPDVTLNQHDCPHVTLLIVVVNAAQKPLKVSLLPRFHAPESCLDLEHGTVSTCFELVDRLDGEVSAHQVLDGLCGLLFPCGFVSSHKLLLLGKDLGGHAGLLLFDREDLGGHTSLFLFGRENLGGHASLLLVGRLLCQLGLLGSIAAGHHLFELEIGKLLPGLQASELGLDQNGGIGLLPVLESEVLDGLLGLQPSENGLD